MKLQKETAAHGRWYNDACGTAFAMEIVGERWALLIIRELMFGPLRFSDIRAQLPGLSAKVLTERLERLETVGVLAQRKLPPPAGVQVYELTEWGRAAEPVIIELGRWAAHSPLHDPSLPLSPASFMLSLRTMFDPAQAGGWTGRIGFSLPAISFVAEVTNGILSAWRAEPEKCLAVLAARDGAALAGYIYGDAPLGELDVRITGDEAAAARFASFFELPRPITPA